MIRILKTALPFTIISFCLLTKCWHTAPVDARDTCYWGFPFAFVGEGWHTSMSLQFFLLEMGADFVVYFLFSALLVFCLFKIKPATLSHKWFTRSIWTLATLCLLIAGLIVCTSHPIFHFTRPYDWVVMETWVDSLLFGG